MSLSKHGRGWRYCKEFLEIQAMEKYFWNSLPNIVLAATVAAFATYVSINIGGLR